MRIKEGYVLREVAGSYVVVPAGERSKEFNGMVNLNESGSVLWKRAGKEFDRTALISELLDIYDVSEQQAAEDVDKFISILKENEFVYE